MESSNADFQNKGLNTISRFSAGTRTVNKTLTGSRRNENYVY